MTEQIGKVTLDYEFYPGRDLYCDGDVEEQILDIVKNNPETEYDKIIEERASWPILYHLSKKRGNIIEWIPFKKTDKILEIGSGCGAITGTIADKAGSVTCVDLSKQRSTINAVRNKEKDNIKIHVGNFMDIEPVLPQDYDYILLIGVFEYGQAYIGGENPYTDFMKVVQKHLKAEGHIVVAIENRFGLKYFAGCKEDHLGTYFSGIEGYRKEDGVRTFTRKNLEGILKKSGISEYSFYYPYPDYKFMTMLFSDRHLPHKGELTNNKRNFDRDRLMLFDEKRVFDEIIANEEFPLFSNSYLFITGKRNHTIYTKYSNDRAAEYAIRTDICDDDSHKWVCKVSTDEAANRHINNIEKTYKAMKYCFEDSFAKMNECTLTSEGLIFPYVEAKTLDEILDKAVSKDDIRSFLKEFKKFCQVAHLQKSAPVQDKDLVFSNILVQKDQWTIIDYEWVSDQNERPEEVICRALYCYELGGDERKEFLNRYAEKFAEFGYSEEEIERVRKDEADFQKHVTGNRLAMNEICEKIGNKILSPIESNVDSTVKKLDFQIYEDRGKGYSEKDSRFLEMTEFHKIIDTILDVDKEVENLRLDPCMEPCMVVVKTLECNGKKIKLKSNGTEVGAGVYTFTTNDPNIYISIGKKNKSASKLHVVMEVLELPRLFE